MKQLLLAGDQIKPELDLDQKIKIWSRSSSSWLEELELDQRILTIEGSVSISLLVRLLLSLLWLQLDHVVDPQDGDGGPCGKLQGLDVRDGGLKDAGLLVVPDHPLVEVEAAVLQLLMLLLGLAGVVVGPQLGHQVRGVLGRVDCQGLGDHQQGLGKISNSKLLPEEQY